MHRSPRSRDDGTRTCTDRTLHRAETHRTHPARMEHHQRSDFKRIRRPWRHQSARTSRERQRSRDGRSGTKFRPGAPPCAARDHRAQSPRQILAGAIPAQMARGYSARMVEPVGRMPTSRFRIARGSPAVAPSGFWKSKISFLEVNDQESPDGLSRIYSQLSRHSQDGRQPRNSTSSSKVFSITIDSHCEPLSA